VTMHSETLITQYDQCFTAGHFKKLPSGYIFASSLTYTALQMAKSLKGAAAVSKLAATLLEVAAPLRLLVPTPSAATAMTSQSVEMSPCTSLPGGPTGAPELPLPPQAKSSIYDPPSGKYRKPGARKQFGPRGRGVFWPRMPCLRCGCPWWLGEDWDAECVRRQAQFLPHGPNTNQDSSSGA
ncbi:hypothetical protein Vafri_11951, partial [Volvox africanus]